mgnify:CR=1 FL=1
MVSQVGLIHLWGEGKTLNTRQFRLQVQTTDIRFPGFTGYVLIGIEQCHAAAQQLLVLADARLYSFLRITDFEGETVIGTLFNGLTGQPPTERSYGQRQCQDKPSGCLVVKQVSKNNPLGIGLLLCVLSHEFDLKGMRHCE